ncbi:hypothetical protein D9757_009266 [Collybiopsis confluens]|uniref:DUF6699 domain-containing protein n=1 Tax=Collybiopsis confluens TaxID=2823264 RepID=A0A8H5HA64_9AGAR|nr:hypothetical protein D9757_009266 [Collybiopsis confluens]
MAQIGFVEWVFRLNVTAASKMQKMARNSVRRSVQWSDSNIFYTTSPNHSPTSSSSGSPGPMTPPPVEPDELRLNEILRFKADLGYVVDLSKDPRHEDVLSSDVLNSPITEPGIPFAEVAAHILPFVIRISKEGKNITVGDLFYRLHLALREKVGDEDLDKEKPEDKTAILEAFTKRCESLKERNIADSVREERDGPGRSIIFEVDGSLRGSS